MKYDAIVVGAGQAGPALAVRLAKAGRKTAIIERKLPGGTCVNVGCLPPKTLIPSARAAHVARSGTASGLEIRGEVRVDMARVQARKDAVVQECFDSLKKWITGTRNLTLIEGHGRFESANSIRVNDSALEAPQIFLDVGGRAAVPDISGPAEVEYLTNSSMMDLDFLPAHLVIVGGSYLGLEFAQMYRRFGSRVTVIEMGPRLIHREDADVSAEMQAMLERECIVFRLNAKCISAARHRGGIRVGASCEDRLDQIEGSHLPLATGRTPNTGDLGLEKAGVKTDKRGFITVGDQLRTNVPGIWALGKANGRSAFTHTSYNDYEIAAANLLDDDTRRVTDRIPVYALFTDPPLGRAGMSEHEVRASSLKALVRKMRMARVGRAREHGKTQGSMKILVDARTERILGASLLGIEGDSIIDVMHAQASYRVIQRAVHIHPTVSELIPTLLGDLERLELAGRSALD